MRTLYVFVDEAGNFDFSPTGTRWFMLAVLSTTEPAAIAIVSESLAICVLTK